MVSKGPRCCTVARDRPLSLELSRNCTSPDSDKRSFYVLRSLAFALVRTVKWNDRIKSPPHWDPARISKAPWTWSLLLDYTTPLYPLFCPNGLFHLFLLTSSCDNDSECQTRKASMRREQVPGLREDLLATGDCFYGKLNVCRGLPSPLGDDAVVSR
jgi:hypothetical protein